MERRFRGIVAAAVLSAKRQKRIVQIDDAARRISAATPLPVSRSQLAIWIAEEVRRQGVPSDGAPVPDESEAVPRFSSTDLERTSRMARESGEFFEGLAKAIRPRIH